MAFLSTPSLPTFTQFKVTHSKPSSSRRPRNIPITTACAQKSQPTSSPFQHDNQQRQLHQHPQIPDRSLDALLEALRTKQQANPTTISISDTNPNLNKRVRTVHLVGTGPGDPGLLTLRSVQLMQSADIVLYDRLVSPEILKFIQPQATMVYVGKESGFHTRSQDDIHLLLDAFADPDAVVVRLKGGDPFVFGRGGEETEYLEQQGVQINAVPGITAAAGIAASLGIPLTKRSIASSVRFLTGHARAGVDVDVGSVDRDTTYVIYMGLGQLEFLVQQFVDKGLEDITPAIAVENGTTVHQRVVTAELKDLPQKVREQGLKTPTLVIVGHVVAMSKAWSSSVVENQLVKSRTEGEDDYVQQAMQILKEYDDEQKRLSENI